MNPATTTLSDAWGQLDAGLSLLADDLAGLGTNVGALPHDETLLRIAALRLHVGAARDLAAAIRQEIGGRVHVQSDALTSCTTCGAGYDTAGFSVLPIPAAGEHMESGVEGYRLALRNCACGSTVSAAVDAGGGYLGRAERELLDLRHDLRVAQDNWQEAVDEVHRQDGTVLKLQEACEVALRNLDRRSLGRSKWTAGDQQAFDMLVLAVAEARRVDTKEALAAVRGAA